MASLLLALSSGEDLRMRKELARELRSLLAMEQRAREVASLPASNFPGCAALCSIRLAGASLLLAIVFVFS